VKKTIFRRHNTYLTTVDKKKQARLSDMHTYIPSLHVYITEKLKTVTFIAKYIKFSLK
jgi:hypothetical protein